MKNTIRIIGVILVLCISFASKNNLTAQNYLLTDENAFGLSSALQSENFNFILLGANYTFKGRFTLGLSYRTPMDQEFNWEVVLRNLN